ncbi:MAG: hypothetical protein IPL61_21510 [Myxococcales bacterium]|nr:hypothetical protein [Myxococcales bacterium]
MRPSLPVFLLVVASASACDRHEARPAPAPTTTPGAAEAPPVASAAAVLDALDGRKPIPLLPMMANHQKQNMRDHLVAVQEIVAALATDDYAAIATAAGRIGMSESMGQMCEHMGAAAPGFTDQALAFHRTADGIGVAARAGDRGQVLTALTATLTACTGCHATWRQQVVDQDGWARATTAPPPHHP